MSAGDQADVDLSEQAHIQSGDGTTITNILDATTWDGDTPHTQILTSSGLSAALRQHVLVLQHQVGELFARPQRHDQEQQQQNEEKAAEEKSAKEAAEANADQERSGKKRRPPGRVREIPHYKPQQVQLDQAEDAEENESVKRFSGLGSAPSEDDAQSKSSECESESSEDEKEAILAEQWDIHSARETVQQLMGQLNMDSRVDVLEGLQSYYGAKLLNIEKDSATISRVEVEAQSGMDYINGAASELNEIINEREIKTYMLLWKYYKTLQKQLAGIDEDYEQQRLQQVRELLINHAREGVKKSNRTVKDLPAGVKPCDMLLVVSEVQKDIESLKASIEIDERKKASYEYTRDYIFRHGLSGINGDPVAGEVIQDLRQWMQKGSKGNTSSQKLANDIEAKEIDYNKLVAEIQVLKAKLAENSGALAARNRQKEEQAKRDAKGESQPEEAKDHNPETSEKKGAQALVLSSLATPTESSIVLFNETTSKEFEKDFEAQQAENLEIENQLRQFEELEALARSAVTTLEEGARKFADVASNAKRNLVIGVLPPEAECEDTKVLQDLKGFDEQLDKRQEEEHLAEMKALASRESELCTQLIQVQTEIDAITVKIAQEKKKKDAIMADMEVVKKEHKEVTKELRKLNLINPKEEQARLDRILDENEELKRLVEGARSDLAGARERVEAGTQAFTQSREAATRLIMTKKKEKMKLKTAALSTMAAARHVKPKPDGEDVQQEDQGQSLEEGEISDVAQLESETIALPNENEPSEPVSAGPHESMNAERHPGGKVESNDVLVPEDANMMEPQVEMIGDMQAEVEAETAIEENAETQKNDESSNIVELEEELAHADRDGPSEDIIMAEEKEERMVKADGTEAQDVEDSHAAKQEEQEKIAEIGSTEVRDAQESQAMDQEVELDEPQSPVRQISAEQQDAAKSRIEGWKQKLGLSPKEKIPERVQKLMEQEQKDNKLAAQLKARSAEINRQIAAVEDWVRKSKGIDIKATLEAEEQKIEEDVPAEVLNLRQQTKKQKKHLQNLRMHWYNVRELAKRGAKTAGGGKEAAELRLAILRICEDALGYNRSDGVEADEASVSGDRKSLSQSPPLVRNVSVSSRNSYVGNADRRPSNATRESKSFRGRSMKRLSTEPDMKKLLGPPVLQEVVRPIARKGTFS